ncbi:(2Fe-2S)-binding protein [Dactylosporangium sp. NPDC005572]|uniref:(2Fe-2S)-binding protein n=1 Tax=Dactylosporangium sp. NPDC005572 TaxID=3156889 RepID=UPI0033BFA9E0
MPHREPLVETVPGLHPVAVIVNGAARTTEVAGWELLVECLRDRFRLTGCRMACETTSCGACTVLFDGESVKSCTVLAVQAHGHEVTTVEGLASPGQMHPLQEAFRRRHALQCGYCTPGMLLAAVSLLASDGPLDEAAVRNGLKGNLCRCTGYQNIVDAVLDVAEIGTA